MPNPKDLVGSKKVPLSALSRPVMMEVGLALLEGACKYGRHNTRVIDIIASEYLNAADRHLSAWYEGEDIDPDSGLSHLTKAIGSLWVLRDAMIFGTMLDDRPPPMPSGWMNDMNKKTEEILAKYPAPAKKYTKGDKKDVAT